jgi:hypothetical protein
MSARMEDIVTSISAIKEAKTKGMALRIECMEKCLDHVFMQLKDIHETLIDLNNNFVDNSAEPQE